MAASMDNTSRFEGRWIKALDGWPALEAGLQQLPVGILLVDPDSGRLLAANRGTGGFSVSTLDEYMRLTNIRPIDAAGQPVDTERDALLKAVRNRETIERKQFLIELNDGRKQTVLVSISPMKLGEIEVGIAITLSDISEQAEAHRALQKISEQNRRLIESSIIGVQIWDFQGTVVEANDAFLEIIGFTRGELQAGKVQWSALTPARWAASDQQAILELRSTGKSAQYEKEFWRKDGALVPVLVSNALLCEDSGYAVSFVIDLTRQKDAEQRIQRSNSELQQLALGVVHDVKTPLRSIRTFSQLLANRYRGLLDRTANEFLEYINEGAQRTERILNDLQMYAQIGTQPLQLEPISFESVLTSALLSLQTQILEAQASVTHDSLPTLKADDSQMVRLFQNLLSNAIKYRRDEILPHIHVSSERRGGEWLFTVNDNGQGIKPEHYERVFQLFSRMHGRKVSGTGVGLANCAKIVERHGGRIWVESQPERGSVFFFTLPAD